MEGPGLPLLGRCVKFIHSHPRTGAVGVLAFLESPQLQFLSSWGQACAQHSSLLPVAPNQPELLGPLRSLPPSVLPHWAPPFLARRLCLARACAGSTEGKLTAPALGPACVGSRPGSTACKLCSRRRAPRPCGLSLPGDDTGTGAPAPRGHQAR